ncbi:MAG: hypothetical protein HOU59_gp34 (endogenous virus) [Lactobacillus phage ViSo-2018a]|uniref:Uncharacterized protein n=1 Tax=Lactobacillus phage ViSo-2018a TaxID=2267607 RepID=A0A3G6JGU4_9CAUD|nr:MAG: hypothetical protein HOU59_gp34 [Lactobacillus phage ViSo-2018a]AZA17299.1 MAG: hypothetical protein DQL93_0600 [Lactobacillus phage ViSo-2018a]
MNLDTLKKIKNNELFEGKSFPEEMHKLIQNFYAGFDLDRQDSEYRENYILHFIKENEPFIVNFQTNVYNAHVRTTDPLSDRVTFCKFLDTLAAYLTKYDEESDG